ncbi:TatD family hydrolase [Methanobrevibacter sp. DSM 116169]|uniref:TatD family hydrolase n=1 Tax=Methanobrevibacter sp. DSM 116169 TaxID=3242727 RepID=UPI0038FCF068
MIDTHCHVDFDAFNEDREEVIKRAKDNLDAIINSGTSLDGNKNVLELSKKYEGFLYPSFGYHPVTSQDKSADDLINAQKHLIENIENIVAIGEVGMDYFYTKDKSLRAKQNEIFTSFVKIADEYEVPLLIHARDCEKKAYNIVKEYDGIPNVIFHCYSGSLKTACKILDEDYFISFSTMICYSTHHQQLASEIPLENILTETDSPYLAMTRDERNEPANVIKAGEKISEIQGINFSEVDKVTTSNAKKVFNIK